MVTISHINVGNKVLHQNCTLYLIIFRIITIRNSFLSINSSIVQFEESCTYILDVFDTHSENEITYIWQLLKRSSSATWLIKDCQMFSYVSLLKTVSTLLSLGVFPLYMKTAIIKQLMKGIIWSVI